VIHRTDGFVAPGSRSASFSFTAALAGDQTEVLTGLLVARRATQCDKDPSLRNASVLDGLPGYDASSQRGGAFESPFAVDRLAISAPTLSLLGRFETSPRGPVAGVVRRLSRGRSATVRSGVRALNDASPQTRAVGRAAVTIAFVRRR
jgi:hypothetical protein